MEEKTGLGMLNNLVGTKAGHLKRGKPAATYINQVRRSICSTTEELKNNMDESGGWRKLINDVRVSSKQVKQSKSNQRPTL